MKVKREEIRLMFDKIKLDAVGLSETKVMGGVSFGVVRGVKSWVERRGGRGF